MPKTRAVTLHSRPSRPVVWVATALVTVALATAGLMRIPSNASAVEQTWTLWSSTDRPVTDADNDRAWTRLGVRFTTASDGWISAIRYYKSSVNQGPHTATLYASDGRALADATFSSETARGWQQAKLSQPVRAYKGSSYVASYVAPHGAHADDQTELSPSKPVVNGPLRATQGVYTYGGGMPTRAWNNSNYYVDVVFSTLTPTTGTGCAARPSGCGYPDATNTGVPAGKTLVKVPAAATSGPGWHWDSRGWVSIDGDGAVFDGYEVNATIDVVGNNVTIRNTRVLVGGETFGIAIRHAQNTTVQDSEIIPPDGGDQRLLAGIKDIYGDARGTRVLRNDISRTSTGVQMDSGLIQDNYIHDLGFKAGDHTNGTTANGGSTLLTIRHNTVFNQYQQTDAISLFQDFGVQSNRVIDNNLMAGGGYSLYAGANPGTEAGATNIAVTNNRFSRRFFPNGGYYGAYTAYTSGGGNTFTGNVWDDTNAPVR